MKRIGIVMLMVFVIIGTSALAFAKDAKSGKMAAGDFEIDGSFGFATGPDDFDSGYGLNFGAGYTLGAVDKNLQVRVDLSYYAFSQDVNAFGFSTSIDYKRVPFTVSARYYFPIIDKLAAFAQAGLETSFDSKESRDAFGTHTKDEVNLGITPGGGVEYFIIPEVSVFAVARWHVISDAYFSMLFGGAYHF